MRSADRERRGAMQDVELLELDVEPADGAGAGPDARARFRESVAVKALWRWTVRAARWGRRRWPVVVAGALVVVVAVGGVQVRQSRQEQARLAALVGVPGILEPLDASTSVRWRAETGLQSMVEWQAVGDVLVGVEQEADGLHAVALDPDTGAVRWDAFADAAEGASTVSGYSSPTCLPVVDAMLLVCLSGLVMVSGPDADEPEPTGPRTVDVVDLTDGAVLAQHTLTPLASIAALGGSLAVAEIEPDGHLRVSSRDPVTWQEAWSYDGGIPATTDRGGFSYARDPMVVVTDDTVTAAAIDGEITVLSRTGERISLVPAASGVTVLIERSGRAYAYRWGGSEGDASVVLDVESGRTQLAGGLLGLSAGDGSLGDTMVGRDESGRPTLMDVGSGETRTLPVTLPENLWEILVVSGQLVTVHQGTEGDGTGGDDAEETSGAAALTDELVAYDGRTGEVRWRTLLRRSISVYAPLLTDGRAIFVIDGPERATAGAPTVWMLVAYGARDGERLWDIAVPDGVARFAEVGGHLYGLDDSGGVSALG